MTRRRRKPSDTSVKVFSILFWILFIVVLIALALWISYTIAGGNVTCMFSKDPALCAQISEVGR